VSRAPADKHHALLLRYHTIGPFCVQVDELDPASADVLTKYIYRLLAGGANSASLLKWHAKLTDKAGLGSLVRALTDRKAV
jgi:hypothetical protein